LLLAMKVLVVTGRLALEQVKASAPGADVLALDVDVAAFITPEMLCRAAPQGYDLILIPGAITADFQEAERELAAKIRLGPKHAADLGFVLRHLDEVELSSAIPACVLMEGKSRSDALAQVESLEAMASAQLSIKGVKIGGLSRMKVLAEVVDSTRLNGAALVERIRYFEAQGADLIDLGVPLDASPSQVTSALQTAKCATNLPVSVDTVVPELILAGIQAGADLILSLNGANLPRVGQAVAAAGVPAVVIPGPGPTGLEENLEKARMFGIPVLADPVLDPPALGLASSLREYILFREAHPTIPLFFGVGNVTELLDSDSTGANALLAALGAEIGASLLFTPEYSAKARGSVHELAIASRMMILAQWRQTPPKDLGLDLLILKEKRRLPEEPMPGEFVQAGNEHKYEPDRAGSFRIVIAEGKILAENGSISVAGISAKAVLNTLIDMGLVKRLDHAGYLGRELEKAEIALALKRSYIQDEPLWPSEKS
jgi:dihydropteroate synthase-like protein